MFNYCRLSKNIAIILRVCHAPTVAKREHHIFLKQQRYFCRSVVHPNVSDEHVSSLLSSPSTEGNVLSAVHYYLNNFEMLSAEAQQEIRNHVQNNISNFAQSPKIYEAYIDMCIYAKLPLKFDKLLSNVKFKPSVRVYSKLLEWATTVGSENDMLLILKLINAAGFPANLHIFNMLVFGYARRSGSEGARSIIEMMKDVQIEPNEQSKWSLLRGLALHDNVKEFFSLLDELKPQFYDTDFFSLLHTIGTQSNDDTISFLGLYKSQLTEEHNEQVINICAKLIQQDHLENAVTIYRLVIKGEACFGMSLLEKLLHDTDCTKVVKCAKYIEQEKFGTDVLTRITGVALSEKHFDKAWALLEAMSKLRPHYFWPILIDVGAKKDESGIFEVIERMKALGVQLDLDTISFYVIALCNMDEPKLLLNRLKNVNLSIRETLTPMLLNLLRTNRGSDCITLLDAHDVVVDGDVLVRSLLRYFRHSKNVSVAVPMLQRICETNSRSTDWTGDFSFESLRRLYKNDVHVFADLLEKIRSVKLSISSSNARRILEYVSRKYDESECDEISKAVNAITDLNAANTPFLKHPADMDVAELECHLAELQHKRMNTRGILRRLLQEHSRLCNFKRLVELRHHFEKLGDLTPGMKGSMLNAYIREGMLQEALQAHEDIVRHHPNFRVDSFKIMDLSGLMIENDQFDEAMAFITKQCARNRYVASRETDRNCWKMLNACKSADQIKTLMEFLLKFELCTPSTIILGPIIKFYIQSGDLHDAVDCYIKFVKKYNCTPMQYELIMALLKGKDSDLLNRVVESSSNVHGANNIRLAMAAAMAELNLMKPLQEYLMETDNIPRRLIQSRCERWVEEQKTAPLVTLYNATERLPIAVLDRQLILDFILKSFKSRNDVDGALVFYKNLIDTGEVLADSFTSNYDEFLRKNGVNLEKLKRTV